ncbi:MAG: DegT/DnrJ/EryC1/StrS family aminotransferase, partial [Ktedonobacterales bacterium]
MTKESSLVSPSTPVSSHPRRPSRSTFLPFAMPHITEAEINEVVDTLRSPWLSTGPKTKRFEREFADAVSAAHAVAVSSATAAMHLA